MMQKNKKQYKIWTNYLNDQKIKLILFFLACLLKILINNLLKDYYKMLGNQCNEMLMYKKKNKM